MCDRNTNFEDEEMTSLELECQDTQDRGYFNAPDNDTDWPQCVRTVSCPSPVQPPQARVDKLPNKRFSKKTRLAVDKVKPSPRDWIRGGYTK